MGFSCLRFLSRLFRAGLGIVPFRRTLRHLRPYTLKQASWPTAGVFAFSSSVKTNEARRGTRQRCPETSWLVGSLEESQPPPRVHAIVTSQLLRWRTAREAWTRVSTPGVSTFFCDFPVAKAPAPHLVLARRRKRPMPLK